MKKSENYPRRRAGLRKCFSLKMLLGVWTVVILSAGLVCRQFHVAQMRKLLLTRIDEVGCVLYDARPLADHIEHGTSYPEAYCPDQVYFPDLFMPLPSQLHLGLTFRTHNIIVMAMPPPRDPSSEALCEPVDRAASSQQGDPADRLTVKNPNRILKDVYLLPDLEIVTLAYSGADNQSLQYLCVLKRLKWLDIAHTQIDDSGVPILARMTQLRRLVAYGTKISAAGFERLKHANPDLQIDWLSDP